MTSATMTAARGNDVVGLIENVRSGLIPIRDAAVAIGRMDHSTNESVIRLLTKASQQDVLDLSHGIDLAVGSPRAYHDTIPAPVWGFQARHAFGAAWNPLVAELREKSGGKCSCCFGPAEMEIGIDVNEDAQHSRQAYPSRRLPSHAHERWSYDDEAGVMTMTSIDILCADCHRVCHQCTAFMENSLERMYATMFMVNGWSEGARQNYHLAHMLAFHARSLRRWTMDLSFCSNLLGGNAPGCSAAPFERQDEVIADYANRLIEELSA